ncbi:MAG: polysaccharide deacetylase family protein [Planctomycetes bacterium]|nr:polysaccharide deacetylase family protein [Planctomycetota bacterium]
MHRRLTLIRLVTLSLCWALPADAGKRVCCCRPVKPRPVVVLTFDDSVKSHYTVARPILKEYGFGATFFITEGFTFKTNKDAYMTWEEIKQLHDDGFEIGNHTRDHLGITPKTYTKLDEQLTGIEEQCAKYGIPKPVSFAWPGNAIAKEAIPILKEHGIRFARRGTQPEYPYEAGKGMTYEPQLDHPLLIPTTGDARPNWTLDNVVHAVSMWKPGQFVVLQFHGVPEYEHPWVHTPEEQFEVYMRFLKSENCRVIALRDLSKFVNPNCYRCDPWHGIEVRQAELAKAEK